MTAESELDRGRGGAPAAGTGKLPDTLVTLRAEGTRPPLYCVHPASGSPFCYSGLARLLDPEQPVFAFEAPGLDGDHPPVRSLAELVDTHLAAMTPGVAARPVRRVSLLGWSMGGTVAFELARRLLATGVDVASLILVDTPVPRWDEPPPEQDILRRFLMEAAGADRATDADVAELRRLLDGAGDPDDFDTELMRHRYAVFRANTHVLVGHRISAPLPLRVDLIRAERSPAEYMRWDRWAEGMRTHLLAGDHMSIWSGASLGALAGTVAEILAGDERHVDD